MIHHLKTWPVYFKALRDGSKTFEIRREDDRRFDVGDVLVLEEYNPGSKRYTGEREVRSVSYLVRWPDWGLSEGMIVMGFRNLNHGGHGNG